MTEYVVAEAAVKANNGRIAADKAHWAGITASSSCLCIFALLHLFAGGQDRPVPVALYRLWRITGGLLDALTWKPCQDLFLPLLSLPLVTRCVNEFARL